MIRSELCDIAGLAVPTFNSHRRNGNLPFVVEHAEARDGTGKAWARFDLDHAMLLIAAQGLAASQGVTWSEAALILREKAIYAPSEKDGVRVDCRMPGFHCARVEFRSEAGDAPALRNRFGIYRGTLPWIVKEAESTVEVYNRSVNFPSDRIVLASFVSVNLSQAWSIAQVRADQLKIDVHKDASPDPLADI